MKKYSKNKEHKSKIIKYLLLVIVLIIYTIFTIYKYGIENGPLVSILTWSFFVFCTPIADAGFLIDFPIRIITGLKMIYSEIIVWIIAALIVAYSLIFEPAIFEVNELLKMFHMILTNLVPYGIIILLSGAGTFFSVIFGDELLETSINKNKRHKYDKHRRKHELILLSSILILILLIYIYLINQMNLNIKFL